MLAEEMSSDRQIHTAGQWIEQKNKESSIHRIELLVDVIIGQLYVVTIGLEPNDNAYAIFETLNATGQALTQADLVRNYFFMRTHEGEHDAMYREEWLPVEH